MNDTTSKEPIYPCPHYGQQDVRVINTRIANTANEPIIRRRRVCLACEHRWTTFEITDAAYASVCMAARVMSDMFPGMRRLRLDNESGDVKSAKQMEPAHE